MIVLAGAGLAQCGQPLFHIEHSINANKLYYEAVVTKDGLIDPKHPISAYWIMWAKDSSGARREKMTWIEKQRAYGFKVKRDPSKTYFWMTLVSYPKRLIEVFMQDKRAVARIIINEKLAYLEKIHINSDGDHFLSKVNFIELFGKDVNTGETLCEKVPHL